MTDPIEIAAPDCPAEMVSVRDACARELGLDLAVVFRRNDLGNVERGAEARRQRQALWSAMRRKGLSLPQIAATCRMTHSAVYQSIRSADNPDTEARRVKVESRAAWRLRDDAPPQITKPKPARKAKPIRSAVVPNVPEPIEFPRLGTVEDIRRAVRAKYGTCTPGRMFVHSYQHDSVSGTPERPVFAGVEVPMPRLIPGVNCAPGSIGRKGSA